MSWSAHKSSGTQQKAARSTFVNKRLECRTHQDGLYDVLGAALEELLVGGVEGDDEGDADRDGAEHPGEGALPNGRLELLSVDLVEELQQDGYDHHRLKRSSGWLHPEKNKYNECEGSDSLLTDKRSSP